MINIIWWQAVRGNWDSGLLCEIFNAHPDLFPQHNSKELLFVDKAIVIVVGCPEIAPLRAYLETLKEGIVILTSEEDGYFDWQLAIPKHLDIWTQYFTERKREIKTRLLMGAPNRIKDYKINKHLPRKYLWSFIGQIQNTSRQQCMEVVKDLPNGFLHIANDFGGQTNGIDYQTYLDVMCQSKFVLACAGSMSTDSFRLYESILCGAIPIVNARCQRDAEDFNYWQEVYPDNDLIEVENWNELPDILSTYIEPNNEWWFDYKKELEQKLINIANA